jgi:uncharacterized protein (DUF1015 family)
MAGLGLGALFTVRSACSGRTAAGLIEPARVVLPARRPSPGLEEQLVPQIRSFRALRFDPAVAGGLESVICPPYDVIGPELHARLLARSPRNAVRIDLPEELPRDEPEDRYRRAGKLLTAWRADGTLRKDLYPGIYVYEQTYLIPGTRRHRTQIGFFARLRLEPFGHGSSVLPHERTLSAPKEDRYRLMKATAVNTSPVIGLYADKRGPSVKALRAIAGTSADIDVTDDDGVRHRLWFVPDKGPFADRVQVALEAAAAGPITIADGHHRYETAIRYRDERRANRTGELDPAADYVLMLFLETTRQKLTVLPTHRIVRELGNAAVATFLLRLHELFEVTPVGRAELQSAFRSPDRAPGGEGRFGLWTREGGAILRARRDSFARFLPKGGEALRRLDVTLLQTALDRLGRIDREAIAAGRLAYTKSVAEALDWVDRGYEGADMAFLLDPTPVADIAAVAADGDVMPQKSTYFYPKALTGLIINPHEW